MKAFLPALLLLLSHPAPAQDASIRRLDNGIHVLLWPVAGQDQVGIEAIYRVGFIHEPDGMTQAAHLIEHLVCNAGTDSFEPRAAMQQLNEIGMANAETLPDWTHYDYTVPADRLELALRIEAERLTSLRIDEREVEIEAPRCYREADFVERNPQAGMAKHAMMVLAQGWRHGREVAHVRSGMEDFDLEALRAFHRRFYRPGNLTLVVVGGFERKAAMELIEKHLGAIPARAEEPLPATDWTAVARRHDMRWDARVRAVCIACPPPESRLERVVLTLWGERLWTALNGAAALRPAVRSVMCNSIGWSVGDLPFFAYAAVKDDADLEAVATAMHAELDRLLEVEPGPPQLAAAVRSLAGRHRTLQEDYVNRIARTLEGRGSPERARGMVLAQGAINWGTAFKLLGADAEALAEQIAARTPAELRAILRRSLARERRVVCTLSPE